MAANVTSTRQRPQLDIEIQEATEADLPRLVEIQLEVFKHLPLERPKENEADRVEHHAQVVAAIQTHIRENSGLKICKAVLRSSSSSSPSPSPASSKKQNNDNDEDTMTIVGFCMWYLPNPTYDTPEARIPTPVRPSSNRVSIPWIKDPDERARAEEGVARSRAMDREYVNGRECGYVRYMAVEAAYQGHGIGHQMMQWGCKLLDDAGVPAYLKATEGGERLYRKFGFERIGSVVLDLGEGKVLSHPAMWRPASVVR